MTISDPVKPIKLIPKQRMRMLLESYVQWPVLYNDQVSACFVMFCTPKSLLAKLSDGKITYNTIQNKNETYNVKWIRCSPATIGNYKNILLSFRRAISEYNLPAYVLISIPDQKEITP